MDCRRNGEDLSATHIRRYFWTKGPDRDQIHKKALQFIEKAIESDPNSAKALATKALLLSLRGDSSAALRQIEIAWKMSPSSAVVNANYSGILRNLGD